MDSSDQVNGGLILGEPPPRVRSDDELAAAILELAAWPITPETIASVQEDWREHE